MTRIIVRSAASIKPGIGTRRLRRQALREDRLDHRVRCGGQKTIDLMRPGTGFVPRE
jgi:hypothetical protein